MSNAVPPSQQHAAFRGRFGVARVDITPPVGVYARNWGAAKHDVAETIHRPLTMTALVASGSNGQPPLVLVDADLGWWRPLELFHEFREQVLNELGIASERFIFALTHTHAAAPLMRAEASLPGSQLLNAWLERTFTATVDVIRQAMANLFDGTLEWHTGHCSLARVRDLPDPAAGASRFTCGFNPESDADDTLLVGRLSDDAGATRVVLVNYACHPTTLAWANTAISPDYIGALRETVEQATGSVAMFLHGNSGELAPAMQYVADPKIADQHGRQLGHAALATLFDMNPPQSALTWTQTVESGAPLALWEYRPRETSTVLSAVRTSCRLPLKDWPSAAELDREFSECEDRTLQERLRRKRDIRRTLGDGSFYELELTAWRLGDAVIIGTCCEAYSHLQRHLRSAFPHAAVASLNLINGSIGYLPPAELYDHDIYPVWQTPFDRGSLEQLEAAMSAVMTELLA